MRHRGFTWGMAGALLLLGAAAPARAQAVPEDDVPPAPEQLRPPPLRTVPVGLSLLPPLGTNRLFGERVRNLVALGLVYDRTYEVTGVQVALAVAAVDRRGTGTQLAGLVAGSAGPMRGIQAGGLAAVTTAPFLGLQLSTLFSGAGTLHGGQAAVVLAGASSVVGVQWAGLAAGTERLHGLQASSGLAYVHRGATGAQVAPVTYAREVHGLQLGLVNVGRRVRGLQVGLVNVSDGEGGIPVGPVHLGGGPRSVDAWGSEVTPLALAWRSGARGGLRFHGLLGAGLLRADGTHPVVVAGTGFQAARLGAAAVTPQLLYQHALRTDPWGSEARALTLRVPVDVRVAGPLRAFAGPSLNVGRFGAETPWLVPDSTPDARGRRPWQVWPGGVLGLRLVARE